MGCGRTTILQLPKSKKMGYPILSSIIKKRKEMEQYLSPCSSILIGKIVKWRSSFSLLGWSRGGHAMVSIMINGSPFACRHFWVLKISCDGITATHWGRLWARRFLCSSRHSTQASKHVIRRLVSIED